MSQNYESKILDHLGLVATMFDELELGQVIDQRIAQDHEQRHVSIGQAVKAMVLNGLGFVNQRLYLVPHFFETKPTERLIGEGVLPEHLNDDTLGRALDALFETGVTELFRDLAAHAASRLGIQTRLAHLDATSFHVDGTYNSQDDEPEDGVIHIRQGYSRDHRPELNQVILNLMAENRTGIPLLMQPLSGNTSDAASFPALIQAHLEQLSLAHGIDYVVADAALYSAGTIKQIAESGSRFITRVPETIKEAQAVLAGTEPEALVPLCEGYLGRTHHSDYGGVQQRWVVIHSEAAQARAAAQVPRRLGRKHEAEEKAFRKLTKRVFSCRSDAERALERFEASLVASAFESKQVLECHHVSVGRGASSGALSGKRSYRLRGALAYSAEKEASLVWRKSLFLLATSEMSEAALSNAEVLSAYKGQHQVERGFRFLKDPAFLARASAR